MTWIQFSQLQKGTQMRSFHVNNAKADALLIWSLITFSLKVSDSSEDRFLHFSMLPYAALFCSLARSQSDGGQLYW